MRVASTSCPEREEALELLDKMLLIRHFEERAQEMYMKAKIGGFLHLAIGEEATVVGTTSALARQDYLISTYREHGQAIARGTDPKTVMAELFGREDGVSRGRGGSMHLFDAERRFLGGYGIVGGNLPLAAGVALASDYRGDDAVTLCMFGDGASNQGTFGETMNLAALWKLPVVFLVVNNQYGMGTALARHSAVTDLSQKAECFGVPGRARRRDGRARRARVRRRARCAARARSASRRWSRRSPTASAATRRPTRRSTARRTRSKQWRERDPIVLYAQRARGGRVASTTPASRSSTRRRSRAVDEAVAFADESPQPALESLYDDIYVLGDQVQGWYSVDERSPEVHRGEDEREVGARGVAHELAEAGAAYAGAGDVRAAARRPQARRRGRAATSEPARSRATRPSEGRRLMADDALPRGAQPGAARGDAGRRVRSS